MGMDSATHPHCIKHLCQSREATCPLLMTRDTVHPGFGEGLSDPVVPNDVPFTCSFYKYIICFVVLKFFLYIHISIRNTQATLNRVSQRKRHRERMGKGSRGRMGEGVSRQELMSQTTWRGGPLQTSLTTGIKIKQTMTSYRYIDI